MTAAAVIFDEPTHAYSHEGAPLLSVTRVLAGAGLVDTFWFKDDDAVRGTIVHALIHRRNHGEPIHVPPDVRGYFDAYERFLDQSKYRIDASEEIVADLTLRCAGTLDLRGTFEPSDPARVDLIDIKAGAVPSWVGYQVAGYARLLRAAALKPSAAIRRWALQLRADGHYTLVPLLNRRDDGVFLAALTIAQAKQGWL